MHRNIDNSGTDANSRVASLSRKFEEEAELTRLLALNAVFEAARAGEAGSRPGKAMAELCALLKSGGAAAGKLCKLLRADHDPKMKSKGQAELNSAVESMRDLGHRIALVSNHSAE